MFNKKTIFILLITFLIIGSGLSLKAEAWNAHIDIAAKPGHSYEKPELAFGPDGSLYIAYREKNPSRNSDIILCRFDGGELTDEHYQNVSNAGQRFGSYKCYETDVVVTEDEKVHVAWVALDRNNGHKQYIQYRYLDGEKWSDIIDLGIVNLEDHQAFFDLRLDVSNNGNVHVVAMTDHNDPYQIKYFSMYDGTVMPVEHIQKNGKGRKKHPDIAVDDNYVHIIWMEKVVSGGPYAIYHQKRENRIGGTKSEIRQLSKLGKNYATQKSRIRLDSQGYFHHAEFYKTGDNKIMRYHKELTDGNLSRYTTVSDGELRLYHWAGLAVRDNSVICAMQLGSTTETKGGAIYFNWQKNGQWQGYTKLENSGGALHESVDLTHDGQVAAIATQIRTEAIRLFTSSDVVAKPTAPLEVTFNNPDMVFVEDNAAFDASGCIALNPDVNILEYRWDFGDGTIEVSSSPTMVHSYNLYDRDYVVSLTITADDERTASITRSIAVKALYSPEVSSVTFSHYRTLFYNKYVNTVRWTPNSKNTAPGFPAITGYQVWRADSSGTGYQLIGEVGSGVTQFEDRQGVSPDSNFTYRVRAVDAQGHISPIDHF